MPQWRKLHTKTTESPDVNEMPDDFHRLLWVLLPLGLDSEGRGMDNPAWVRSKLMPIREDVSLEMVGAAMDWFAERGMIERYQVAGRAYFWAPTFREYQGECKKEAASEFPGPPGAAPPPNLPPERGEEPEAAGSDGPKQVGSRSGAGRELVESGSGAGLALDVDIDSDSEKDDSPASQGADARPPGPSGDYLHPKNGDGDAGCGPEGCPVDPQSGDLGSNGPDPGAESVENDRQPQGAAPMGGEPGPPENPARAMFAALAWLCQVDLGVMTKAQRGELNQAEKVIREKGFGTPELIAEFGDWWGRHDWRGKRGDAPSPDLVRREWGKFMAWRRKMAECAPALTPQPPLPEGEGESRPEDVVWEQALVELRGQMTQAAFDARLAGSHVLRVDGERWVIGVPGIQAATILSQSRQGKPVQRVMAGLVDGPVELAFEVDGHG